MLSKKAYQILYNDAEEAVMLLCRAECSAAAEAGPWTSCRFRRPRSRGI